MMSFELKKGKQGGIDFMNKLKMCIRTVSLGTAETILCHPASMTHYAIPKEEKPARPQRLGALGTLQEGALREGLPGLWQT